MPVALFVTPFAEWLDGELRARGWNQSQLAAYMGKRQQTISSWFTDDRIPQSDMCLSLAEVLRVPAEFVLQKAGHLPADYQFAEPELPAWLTQHLEKLTEDELRVVDATARGLLAVREEREAYEANRPAPPEPPPPA